MATAASSQHGRCNCGSITVSLSAVPDKVYMCHCFNCRRAGGPCSINYLLDDGVITVNDPKNFLKEYQDHDTKSGNVCLRNFCSNCGSPIFSIAAPVPGKKFLKASLFETIATTNKAEVFTERQIQWA